MSQFAVILAAAGKSSRFGDPFYKKVFMPLNSKPMWMYAAEKFADRAEVSQVLIVISPDDKEMFNEKFATSAAMLGVQPVLGGNERADSVRNALAQVQSGVDFVAVHDAARPCISEADIRAVVQAAADTGAAILATQCSSTVKRVSPQDNVVLETVPRQGLWLAQTPQVFRVELLRDAYQSHPDPSAATDDASIVETVGGSVRVVEGSPMNIKVTTKADLHFAELVLKQKQQAPTPLFPKPGGK